MEGIIRFFKKNKDQVIVGLIVGIVTVLLTHCFDLRLMKKEHEIYDNNDTETELLIKAQDYYKLGQYDKVVEIYNLEKLDHNPVAMSNLAYFYAKGIYLNQDISRAKELYKNAYKLDENYIDGYFMIVIDHPEKWNEVMEVVEQGALLKCSSTCRFLAYMYKEDLLESQKADEYLKMNATERKDFLLAGTENHYEWSSRDLLENDFLIQSAQVNTPRKEKIGTYIDDNGDIKPLYGTVTYKCYEIVDFVFASRVCDYQFITVSQKNENMKEGT